MTLPRRRRWLVALGILGAIITLMVAAAIPVYVRPQVEPLRPADVILVLGGHSFERYEYALELASEGYAPAVLVSAPSTTDPYTDPDANPDSDNDGDRIAALCQQRHSVTVICFQPDPDTTRGEARELGDQAAAHGWNSAIVVTMTPQISRARYIIGRCFDGQLTMVSSPEHISLPYWTWSFIYQTAGFVTASLQDGC